MMPAEIHHRQWFYWAIVTIAVVAVVLLFFIFQARREFERLAYEFPAVTVAQWKTFQSKELGLAVRYPPNWQIDYDRTAPSVTLEDPANFDNNFAISVVNPALEPVIRKSLTFTTEHDVAIDGLPGKWFLGANPKDKATGNVILVRTKTKLYYLAGQSRNFEKIIKSLKFSPEAGK